ncbi:response regulator [Mucilaginibacter sp. KACC 22063]|uniref:response regulator n=1 Tax=Mucilaginibacter sp. KACC 22063 TaxID=3025666 RepID=UPI00236727FF|nr:response regulator [Mucilaginibacter sp. KACC 22063]WDF57063.1 response regulator [Mucilaginibacter sp. KACC 22063]
MLKLSFRNQVLLGFAFSIVLVLLVGFFSYRSIKQLQEDEQEIQFSQDVIEVSNHVLQLLTDGETGVRGYAATNKPVFLDPYKTSLTRLNDDLAKLKSFGATDKEQQANILLLSDLVSRQLEMLKVNIESRDKIGLEQMVAHNMLLNGKQNMDSIRSVISRIDKLESAELSNRKAVSDDATVFTVRTIIGGSGIFLVIIVFMLYYIQSTFRKQKQIEEQIKDANTQLEGVLKENEEKNWLLTGAGDLNSKMQGQQTEKELTSNVLAEVCRYAGAITGTFYLYDDKEEVLELNAWYAYHDLSLIKQKIKLSESWMGQVAKDKKAATITGNLNQKLELETSIISQELAEIFIVPVFFDKKLIAVMEVAFQQTMAKSVKDYIIAVADTIGVAINTARARRIMQDLFEETQQQAEELEAQQEEMRVTNEELLTKTEALQASEEELKVQQEELRTINAELEEKASLLEEKNHDIERARAAITEKVEELETTGRYKSEFLANMSHELRTPLNSILVLARILKDNKHANLSDEQIKYASVIFNAGNDLLTLINDILDLAKIESGKVELQNDTTSADEIVQNMQMLFAEIAENKQINFTANVSADFGSLITDRIRLEQVIKNLLSNAFKFTPVGGHIELDVTKGAVEDTVSFRVKDSGIGIPADKQKLIFEAFQQADGSTSRKYGGTGLGLSISRELATLLGGQITIKSEPGQGSEFCITIPLTPAVQSPKADHVPDVETFISPQQINLAPAESIASDHEPLVVIVEDDRNFADILKDYAGQHGYKAVLVHTGSTAVDVIAGQKPDAVILDIMLPGKDGWQILKELKDRPETKNIPVHLMSAGEAAENRVKREGAISFMKKPVDTEALDKLFGDISHQHGAPLKHILLIEDQEAQSDALKELMQKQNIEVDQAFNGQSALDKLQHNEYQCVVLDLNLPDISGLDLLDKIKGDKRFSALPVIINTAMELDKNSVTRLMQYANAMVVKTSKSSDRLIDEVNLFLHKLNTVPVTPAAPAKAKSKAVAGSVGALKGKKVLLVDDDMRNIFALSSALQSFDLEVEIANDGEEALTKLENTPGVDIVLMDIMMPKMDGYEATRQIRKQNKWAKLPVIALTAKAMKDDREKCIAAGANDYITKPVDMDQLVALMQLWLQN